MKFFQIPLVEKNSPNSTYFGHHSMWPSKRSSKFPPVQVFDWESYSHYTPWNSQVCSWISLWGKPIFRRKKLWVSGRKKTNLSTSLRDWKPPGDRNCWDANIESAQRLEITSLSGSKILKKGNRKWLEILVFSCGGGVNCNISIILWWCMVELHIFIRYVTYVCMFNYRL